MREIYIHVLTDTVLQSRYSHLELARLAFAGGADVVQYRNKALQPGQIPAELREMALLSRMPHQKLVVNDNPALAAVVAADGVHLGREDASPDQARALLGIQAIIGATVHSIAELEALAGQPIDYIGVGPVFGTSSKNTGLPPLGLEGLAEICRRSPWPVIAIGSITRANAKSVIEAGAAGVAVLSDICCAENPQEAVEELRHILA